MQEELLKRKKIIWGIFVLVAAMVILGIIYTTFAPKTTEGAKTLSIEVIDNNAAAAVYTVHTDAAYLRQALEETEGLSIAGTESEYGMMVETVNGVTADYNTDGAYWAFYVDGEYCNYGIDSQPVEDGQSYRIVYTIAK